MPQFIAPKSILTYLAKSPILKLKITLGGLPESS